MRGKGLLFAATAALAIALPAITSADSEAPAAPGPICGGHAAEAAPSAPATVLLKGYGTGGFIVRTSSPQAQAFFDNGMQLGHAFAHKASIAAFQEARRLDPGCAMCAWGEAWSRGPTINYGIDAKTRAELAGIAEQAAVLAQAGPEKERQLTAALRMRYRKGGDEAFARAMDAIAHAHADDNELAILAADAWMIATNPHNKADHLGKALALLGPALQRNPDDTGAIHFYIHATEADEVPDRALAYAERLQALAPAASHLVHMPSHTYYWVGHYAAAVRANQDAVQLDEANARRLDTKGGVWGLTYHSHNVMFGMGAALIDGDGRAALGLARGALGRIAQVKPDDPFDQVAIATAYFSEGRYGDEREVAALGDPGDRLPFLRAMWRYARGEAAARRGDLGAVKAEAAALGRAGGGYGGFGDYAHYARDLQRMAGLVLQGRIAVLENRPADAAGAFRTAAGLQEAAFKDFTDPPIWWYPVRRSLAAAELQGGQAGKAEAEAKAVLARTPDDPMTLLVLAHAEQALGHAAEAGQALAKARAAWRGDPAALDLKRA